MSSRCQVATDTKTRSRSVIADLMCLEGLCDFFNSWRLMWSPITKLLRSGSAQYKVRMLSPSEV